MCKGRRAEAAENASNAAVLVVIIALLIILYVLMLPPEARDALLDGTSQATPPSGAERDVLLSWVPPSVSEQEMEVRPLPFFNLRTELVGDVVAERSGLALERSVFHQESDTIRFSTPPNVREMLLSFSVAEAAGRLQIDLNGERIHDLSTQRRQPEPIVLPETLLEDENELSFSVSGVGFSFWQTNRYMLQNVRVTADVTDYERADHTQRFVVENPDLVRRAQLHFVPECLDQQGQLSVSLNEELVYQGFPACGVPISADLSPSRLNPVENTLEWSVNQGEYVIDQVEVSFLHEREDSRESFRLSEQQLQELSSQGRVVEMSLRFADRGAEGVVVVNGEPLAFRTDSQSFAASIMPYVQEGANTVEVQESSSPVALLEVRIR